MSIIPITSLWGEFDTEYGALALVPRFDQLKHKGHLFVVEIGGHSPVNDHKVVMLQPPDQLAPPTDPCFLKAEILEECRHPVVPDLVAALAGLPIAQASQDFRPL